MRPVHLDESGDVDDHGIGKVNATKEFATVSRRDMATRASLIGIGTVLAFGTKASAEIAPATSPFGEGSLPGRQDAAGRATADAPLTIAIDEGTGPLVVLLHGFPELPSSWRHQVDPLVEAGYRVVAPYLRGYGPSPAPAEPAAYTTDLLVDDVARVIEACGEETAVVVGHDQGADVAWAMGSLAPERVRAVVGLSIPFARRPNRPPMELLREAMGATFFYALYFQTPGVAEAELEGNERRFLLSMYAAASGSPPPGALRELPAATGRVLDQLPEPASLPAFLDPDDFEAAVATFTRTGFTGGLNIYRAKDLTWAKLPELGERTVEVPAAFVAGDRDPALGFIPQDAMAPPFVADLRLREIVPGAGHWVQLEAPEAITNALLGFLAALD